MDFLRIVVLLPELEDRQQELADRQQKLADRQKELQKLADTQQELADTQQELADTQQKLADTQQELSDFIDQLPDSSQSLTDVEGNTLVHLAAIRENGLATLRLLVQRWGDKSLTEANKCGDTPLHYSAMYQDSKTMQFVKEKRQDVFDSRTFEKRTVFHCAAMNEKSNSVFKWLVKDQKGKCLTLRDEENNTPVHYSAMFQDEKTMQLVKGTIGTNVFYSKGSLKRTVFHCAAMNERSNSAFKELVKDHGEECLTLIDELGNTPVHYSAMYHSEETMQLVKKTIKAEVESSSIFYSKGSLKRTVFHWAALNEKSNSAFKWLVNDQGEKCLTLTDAQNASVIQLAVSNQDAETLELIKQTMESDTCFERRGHLNRPTICYAALNLKSQDAVQFLLERQGNQRLLDTDDLGRNFFHFCALNPKFGVQLMRKAVTELNLKSEADAINTFLDNEGRNPLHYACLMKNFPFIFEFLPSCNLQNMTDTKGNTLLHSFFQVPADFGYCRLYLEYVWKFFKMYSSVRKTRDFSAENSRGHTCLMAAEIKHWFLSGIISNLSGETYQKLLTNSEGLHAIHVFSGRYRLQHLLPCMTQLSGKSQEQLLRIRVTSGHNTGATCLHFACEAGHKKNIEFLLENTTIKLSDVTHDGRSCIDFAFNKGVVDSVLDAANKRKIKLEDVLCLIDPSIRALQLPQTSHARRVLGTFVDSKLSSHVEKGRKVGMGEEESPDAQLLFRAVELDSSEMLRSLLTLGFSVEKSHVNLVSVLSKKVNEADNKKLRFFPNAEKFTETFGDKNISIFEFCVYFDKVNVLSDLAVIRQFDLIPQCITLLILLKTRLQKKEGKLQQLTELQATVFAVVMNALDSLYNNGDESQKELLFRYLTADFDGGPKFEFRSEREMKDADTDDTQRLSVVELLHILDSDKVFGTDCLSGFVDRQWTRKATLAWKCNAGGSGVTDRAEQVKSDIEGRNTSCSRCSWHTFNVKFAIYLVSFFAFLLYFAWFLTDFRRTFTNPVFDIVMYLYAVSFTAQEVNDFATRYEKMYVSIIGRRIRTLRYFTYVSNYFDFFALVPMWVGLIWKSVLPPDSQDAMYWCQMVMASSFLLWGFRSVSLLSFFEIIGPRVSMLRTLLLKDLVSLLLLLAVIFYSFSVFFFSLLYSDSSSSSSSSRNGLDVVKEIWKFPWLLAFGLFATDDLQPCNRSLAYPSWLDCTHDVGHSVFSSIFVFVFMLLVNIVMWNLLIALFSLTVARKESRAVAIWRKNRFDLLKEFEEMSVLPPPVSFVEFFFRLATAAARRWCCCGNDREKAQRWRLDDWSSFPEDFVTFLQYQAEQLRQERPKLLRRVETHRSDTEALKAFTENSLANTRELMSKEVATVKEQVATVKEQVATVKEQVATVQQEMNRQLHLQQKKQRNWTKKQRKRTKKRRRQMDVLLLRQFIEQLQQQQQQQPVAD